MTLATSSTGRKRTSERAQRVLQVLRQVGRIVALGLMVGATAILVVLFVYPPLRDYATPQSYVYGDTQTAVLVQWSEHSTTLDGTFQLASVDASAGVIRVNTSAFSGTHDGSHLTLDFAKPALGAVALSGTLSWRSLQLDLPQTDGQLAPVRLVPGDLTAYNAAVQALKHGHPSFEIQGN